MQQNDLRSTSVLKNSQNSTGVFAALSIIFRYLPKSVRGRFLLFTCLGLVAVALELLAVSAVATLAAVLSNPTSFLENQNERIIALFGSPITAQQVIVAAGLVAACSVTFKNIARAIFNFNSSRFLISVDRLIGEKLLRELLARDYTWISQKNTSDLHMLVTWRRYFGSIALTASMNIIIESIFIISIVVLLISVDPITSGGVIVFVGIIALSFYRWNSGKLDKIAILDRKFKVGIGRLLVTVFHGVKDVLMFTREKQFIGEFSSLASGQTETRARQIFLTSLPSQLLEVVGVWSLVIAIIILLHVSSMSNSEILSLVALIAVAAWRTLPSLSKLLTSVVQLRNSLPYLKTLSEYLITDITVTSAESESQGSGSDGKELLNPFQSIKLKDIEFSFPTDERKVLNGCSLTIEKGSAIGIVGPSGAGKSTLIDLLAGLIDPQSGKIFLNGEEISIGNSAHWRQKIGYVGQSPYIMDGSLSRNIAFGVPEDEVDYHKLRVCCEAASIDFWESLPDGFETEIGERGVMLSGGQRQRIAIARALYADPSILILDEATSALDTKTENEIRETVYKLKGQVTLVIVAHRLKTVEECDIIHWLEAGAVRMCGTPSEVLPQLEAN